MKKKITLVFILTVLISTVVISASKDNKFNNGSNHDFEIETDVSEELEFVVHNNGKPFEGYTLFTPWFSTV